LRYFIYICPVQSLIASYLFQQKSVSLPGLGRLNIETLPAQSDFVNKWMQAPQATIRYSSEAIAHEQDGLVQYIGQKKGISWHAATDMLAHWVAETKTVLQKNGQFYLAYTGTFFQKGTQLSFTQASLPTAFFPQVIAERVIHPDADHSMLVGDKETTAAKMTEYFAEEPVRKRRWWVAALVIALLSLGLITFNLSKTDFKRFTTGNSLTVTAAEVPLLHQIIPM
jgi:hypothetical protein